MRSSLLTKENDSLHRKYIPCHPPYLSYAASCIIFACKPLTTTIHTAFKGSIRIAHMQNFLVYQTVTQATLIFESIYNIIHAHGTHAGCLKDVLT